MGLAPTGRRFGALTDITLQALFELRRRERTWLVFLTLHPSPPAPLPEAGRGERNSKARRRARAPKRRPTGTSPIRTKRLRWKNASHSDGKAPSSSSLKPHPSSLISILIRSIRGSSLCPFRGLAFSSLRSRCDEDQCEYRKNVSLDKSDQEPER